MKLSTKKNRFPHTFSKAPCSGMQLFRTSRGRVQPPLGADGDVAGGGVAEVCVPCRCVVCGRYDALT